MNAPASPCQDPTTHSIGLRAVPNAPVSRQYPRNAALGPQKLPDSAETLRRLWALLPRGTVMEDKSPGRPYRAGNLDRLWSYVHTHFSNERSLPRKRADGTTLAEGMAGVSEVWRREDRCAVLVVPALGDLTA
jgi:hypothetical protein